MKTIGLILSYNNPEMTDRLVENIKQTFASSFEYIVLDNGSESDKISQYTTDYLPINIRMTRGFNSGIDIINEKHPDYDNIWFFTNDCFFYQAQYCPLEISEQFLKKYPDIGILHPSESNEVQVCFDVHHDEKIQGAKIIEEYDFVCPIITRKALEIMGGKFDDKLYHGWGIDYESSYLVRKAGMVVAINHLLQIGHNTSSTYDKKRDNMYANRTEFYNSALNEMRDVLKHKYGIDWHNTFINTFNENHGVILTL